MDPATRIVPYSNHAWAARMRDLGAVLRGVGVVGDAVACANPFVTRAAYCFRTGFF